MAPTIQNGANNGTDIRPQRPQEKKSELICRVKYSNNLPDIPFDLKFITYPFENDRFIQYNPTSLERNYKYEVLTEHDLGVTIDLINRDLYQSNDPYVQLDPADERLLEEDVHAPQDSVRSRHHAKSVSWLRKSEYISTEQTRFQPQNMEKVEAKVGYNVKKSLREETLYMDRDSQIKAIQKTFDDSQPELIKHYSKPGVVAEEVFPLFPDFSNWKYPCAQVIFDADPAPIGKNVPAQLEEMSQAMIRGVMDESGEQFVAYFLPTEPTLEKRRNDFGQGQLYEDDMEYEYKMAREYNWNVKSKASSKGYEENYFFIIRNDGVYYNELETRVRLSKRRQKIGQAPNNTKLVVKHRPLNASEHRLQRYRERQLEAPGEEEEDEEAEEEEAPAASTSTKPATAVEGDDAMAKEDAPADEAAKKQVEQDRQSRASRSRTKSQSRSRSRSHSGSSRSRSRSRSNSRSVSRSRSRSHSGSRRSGSGSPAHSARSGSGSPRSRSGSPDNRQSRSRSRSGSARSRSHSGSSRSRSRSGSRSSSPSGSGSASE